MNGWLVVRTHTHREMWACENITRQGAVPYLPRYAERAVLNKSKIDKITVAKARCLFPSYVFVRPMDGRWRFLLGTFGVTSIVMFGGIPATVPEWEIDKIRRLEDAEGLVQLPKSLSTDTFERFVRGSSVRVTGGAFSGMVGIYEGSSSHDRERVLLDYLGGKRRVLIGSSFIEPVLG